MAYEKIKIKGGSGGKLGHSNMSHWNMTDVLKKATKKRRRLLEKKEISEEMKKI